MGVDCTELYYACCGSGSSNAHIAQFVWRRIDDCNVNRDKGNNTCTRFYHHGDMSFSFHHQQFSLTSEVFIGTKTFQNSRVCWPACGAITASVS